ncbi:MAG: GNAT family N-acetyltransferase [Bacteroidota bacterium]
MEIIETTELSADQQNAALLLWNNEYPVKLRYHNMAEFTIYLEGLQQVHHFFLVDALQNIAGWAFAFTRNDERWFAIILDSSIHQKGYGSMLLNKLKEKEPILNGWVIDHDRDFKLNGEKYVSPLPFYLKNNFVTHPDIRIDAEKLSAVKIKWTN